MTLRDLVPMFSDKARVLILGLFQCELREIIGGDFKKCILEDDVIKLLDDKILSLIPEIDKIIIVMDEL